MTDILGTSESKKSVRQRIYSKNSFLAKLIVDRGFKSEIVGCSSFSLTQIKRNMSSNEISIQPYGPQNSIMMDLDAGVHYDLFKNYGTDEDMGVKYIFQNASHGKYWASLELAKEYGISDQILWSGDDFKLSLHTISDTIQASVKDKRAFEVDLQRTIMRVSSLSVYESVFGSFEKVSRYFSDLSQRNGVQIIYSSLDKQDFVKFVSSSKHHSEDDRAVQIYNRSIPNKFISAIIPLGKYEKEKLARL